MSNLATLTKMGRAAIVKAIAERPLHLAWGTGDPAWDDPDTEIPSLVQATALFNEIGRRLPASVGFVTPDENGGIVIPISRGGDAEVQEARYAVVTTPTPYLYVRTNYDFGDASNVTIRELAVFMDTVTDPDLPPGQRYFTPVEVVDPGLMLAAQILRPGINRSPSVRQTIEFVLPI